MINLSYPPKPTVGCRMSLELREQLENEAREAGQTLSAHIETVLLQRGNADVDVEALKHKVFLLEAENAELLRQSRLPEIFPMQNEPEIRSLKQQVLELREHLRRAIAERNTLAKVQGEQSPFWLSKMGYQNVVIKLQKMKSRFPANSLEQLLLSSLDIVLHNETAFRVRTLRNVLTK